jgi:hypothetical protein
MIDRLPPNLKELLKDMDPVSRAFPAPSERQQIHRSEGGQMEFPDTIARRLTERILADIREHLRVDPKPHENHHFNRTYEKVYAVLDKELRGR